MVDIGAIGENAFAFWCSQAGLTANLVRKDVYGWDFYVQFPRTETHHPLDARPPQLMCMVQVKTTAVGATDAPIKLDNWERMVSEPLPWFVFALSLDGVAPSKAHLVHIGKEHTERVLRRLRELRKSEPDAAEHLNRKEMDCHWHDGVLLPEPDGEAIRDRIAHHIGPDLLKYAEMKTEWYRTVGYEDHPRRIQATITARSRDAMYRQFRDVAIGIVDKLPITALEVTDCRFGIPIEEFSTQDDGGYLHPSEPLSAGEVDIEFSDIDRSQSVSFRCSIFSSRWVFPFLPRRYWRLRLASDGVIFIIDDPRHKRRLTMTVELPIFTNLDHDATIGAITRAARFLHILSRAPEHGVKMEVVRDGARSGLPPLHGPFRISPDVSSMARVVEEACACATHFGVDANARLVPQKVLDLHFRVRILWSGLFGRADRLFPVQTPTTLSAEQLGGRLAAVVVGTCLPVANHVMACAIALVGPAQWTPSDSGGDMLVPEGTVRLLWKQLIPVSEWSAERALLKMREAAQQLKNEGIDVVRHPAESNALVAALLTP